MQEGQHTTTASVRVLTGVEEVCWLEHAALPAEASCDAAWHVPAALPSLTC